MWAGIVPPAAPGPEGFTGALLPKDGALKLCREEAGAGESGALPAEEGMDAGSRPTEASLTPTGRGTEDE